MYKSGLFRSSLGGSHCICPCSDGLFARVHLLCRHGNRISRSLCMTYELDTLKWCFKRGTGIEPPNCMDSKIVNKTSLQEILLSTYILLHIFLASSNSTLTQLHAKLSRRRVHTPLCEVDPLRMGWRHLRPPSLRRGVWLLKSGIIACLLCRMRLRMLSLLIVASWRLHTGDWRRASESHVALGRDRC